MNDGTEELDRQVSAAEELAAGGSVRWCVRIGAGAH